VKVLKIGTPSDTEALLWSTNRT